MGSIRRALAYLCMALPLCSAASAEVRKLTILHTNDLHSRVIPDSRGRGGFAEIAAALRAEREGCSHCIHLGAGDLITGMPVSTLFQGTPVFSMANRLKLDAFALGNHEFDHGWRQIQAFRKKARFPLLSANVLGPDGRSVADAPYTILRVNGLRVGVIGVVMGNLIDRYLTPATAGPIKVLPVVDTVRAAARELAGRTDVVVALGHILQAEGEAILHQVPAAAIVVEGHNHGGRPEMLRAEGRVLVGLRSYGVEVGRLDLEVDTETRSLVSAAWKRIPIEAGVLQPAPDMARRVTKWERKVMEIVDTPIAEAARSFTRSEVKDLIERAFLDETGADFTHMNRGGVRDELGKGVIRIRDWFNIMPFENEVLVARVRGVQVNDALRAGREVAPQREYLVALSNYAVENASLREELGLEGMEFEHTGRTVRQLLIDWTRKQQRLE